MDGQETDPVETVTVCSETDDSTTQKPTKKSPVKFVEPDSKKATIELNNKSIEIPFLFYIYIL